MVFFPNSRRIEIKSSGRAMLRPTAETSEELVHELRLLSEVRENLNSVPLEMPHHPELQAEYPPTLGSDGELKPGQTAVINGAPYRSKFGKKVIELFTQSPD